MNMELRSQFSERRPVMEKIKVKDTVSTLSHQQFLNRETHMSHLDYNRENEFFTAVRDGRYDDIMNLFVPFNLENMGRLSSDSLRNLKYHLVITLALTTRACIEGGMEMETAYTLSDVYIMRLDGCRTEAQLNALHKEAVEDYALRMSRLHSLNRYPKSVKLCMDYIYDNLHKKITLSELAKVSLLSESYLCRLFKKEAGMGISDYIALKRIEAAQNMLKYTDTSIIAISDYFCFSSESYFIRVFKEHTGITPKAYREKYFRVRKS